MDRPTSGSAPHPARTSWRERWRAWHAWRRRPHFLGRTRLYGSAAWLIALVVALARPFGAWQAAAAIAMLAVIVTLPVRPRVVAPAGLAAALACGFVPGGGVEPFVAIALFSVFLTAGYAIDGRLAAALAIGYAAVETASATWLASLGARSGAIDMLRMLVGGMTADGRAITPDDVPPMVLWAFGTALSAMLNGFAVLFGRAFRRSAAVDERLARSEAMVGRLTREQQLAHMIHDSVANDMSVIAMLAWRARAGLPGDAVGDSGAAAGASDPDVGGGGDAGGGSRSVPPGRTVRDPETSKGASDLPAVLDAIYARSHHALDRVHEVIDVLDGTRSLEDLEDAPHAGAGARARDDDGSSGDASDLTVELERLLEDQDRVMGMIGMPGVSRIVSDGAACAPAPRVRRAVLDLVEELYANIVRHAAWTDVAGASASDAGDVGDAGDGMASAQTYSLLVSIGDGRIRVTEVNAIGDGESVTVRGTRHGNGLRQQRESIEALGGTLNAAAQDGTWTVCAEIPTGV